MRTWRKLYCKILDSEQVSVVSDGAAYLLALLIAAQDDSGYWPWTATKVRRLIASRPGWSLEHAEALASELVTAGIAEWIDGGLLLCSGKELNGRFRQDSESEFYPRNTPDTASVQPVTSLLPACHQGDDARAEQSKSRVRAEQRSGEESSMPPPPPKAKASRSKEVTPEFLTQMAKEYPMLNVDRIYRLKFSPWCKQKGLHQTQLRLTGWLERDARDVPQNGNQPQPTPSYDEVFGDLNHE